MELEMLRDGGSGASIRLNPTPRYKSQMSKTSTILEVAAFLE